jgi:hypothetical protein
VLVICWIEQKLPLDLSFKEQGVISIMKKAVAFSTVLAILATPALFANPHVYTVASEGNGGYGPYQTGSGGEFTLYSPDLPVSQYYSLAMDQDTADAEPNFQTFCVEGTVYIYPWTTYDATLTGRSTLGDPLTKGVAWLYYQFASGGNFDGDATYNYGANRSATAAELQDAIWAFMGQEGQTFANNSGNPFLMAAEDQFGGLSGADARAHRGYDGTYILDLWNGSPCLDNPGQGQLYWKPCPDGGTTMMLLGSCLAGLAWLRRKI